MAVAVEVQHDVAVVTMTAAQRMNPLDPELLHHLRELFKGLLDDQEVRAMVVTGQGRVFSAGADVQRFQQGIADGTVTQWLLDATEQLHALLSLLHRSAKPMVAAVNGVAAGGGLGLALVADSRIGSADARFAAGYLGLGASPDGGSTWLMPRLVGAQRTRRFLLDNEVMDAHGALACGLLDELVPADRLVACAVERARRWGQWAQHSREATKRLLDAQHTSALEPHLELERALIAASAATPEFREGVAAFLDKRAPDFSGMHRHRL